MLSSAQTGPFAANIEPIFTRTSRDWSFRIWGINPTDDAEFDAAARDRNFDSTDGATTVAQSFYLRAVTANPSVRAGAATS